MKFYFDHVLLGLIQSESSVGTWIINSWYGLEVHAIWHTFAQNFREKLMKGISTSGDDEAVIVQSTDAKSSLHGLSCSSASPLVLWWALCNCTLSQTWYEKFHDVKDPTQHVFRIVSWENSIVHYTNPFHLKKGALLIYFYLIEWVMKLKNMLLRVSRW